MSVCSSFNSLFFLFTGMEAWQLLQGNIPSVIGGGVYSSTTAMAEEAKKSSRSGKVTEPDTFMILLEPFGLTGEIHIDRHFVSRKHEVLLLTSPMKNFNPLQGNFCPGIPWEGAKVYIASDPSKNLQPYDRCDNFSLCTSTFFLSPLL